MEGKEIDKCMLEEHEERLKSIDSDLQCIKHDMLLMDDYESIAGRAGGLDEALFDLQLSIKRRLKNIKIESTVGKEKGLSSVKLPKVSVLTIDGDVLKWKSF